MSGLFLKVTGAFLTQKFWRISPHTVHVFLSYWRHNNKRTIQHEKQKKIGGSRFFPDAHCTNDKILYEYISNIFFPVIADSHFYFLHFTLAYERKIQLFSYKSASKEFLSRATIFSPILVVTCR